MKYLVLTRRTPQFRDDLLGDHYAFLDGLRRAGHLECAGPFTDRSGGAYLLIANSLDEAKHRALADPLHVQGCSNLEILEWDAR
ncbi:hypothetical protein FSZ31_05000 [Sphingorhabdus soli]|uniref:YCII-related domain-containing protein n=1 Tax=Flavisphingopyxis soli TaxID=2601267 RepID=A0A5C6UT38_9SPHN|nr:YciI family protein [Sphingorhabdus soli]TXC74078.1 hypothetical protein FSZ31_05000 [Sphingorhabdus soli]